ncbi:hypothetical protein [Bartonella massiliensis]|uniref:hypothetical protein n=1 Tax=Bartonella massiliensis TaxID=929795 RepID=UPI001FE97BA3|nr:hypothetical protein [Bartonella massiliensis]
MVDNVFLRKPVGLISHGSASKNAHSRANIYCRCAHTLGRPLQCQVASAKEDFASDDKGFTWKVISEEVRICCEHLADEMCAF